MATKPRGEFANIVSTLHNLELTWSRAKAQGTDTKEIERTIYSLISKLSDEELRAYSEYMRERERQARESAAKLSGALAEAQAELNRRKAK